MSVLREKRAIVVIEMIRRVLKFPGKNGGLVFHDSSFFRGFHEDWSHRSKSSWFGYKDDSARLQNQQFRNRSRKQSFLTDALQNKNAKNHHTLSFLHNSPLPMNPWLHAQHFPPASCVQSAFASHRDRSVHTVPLDFGGGATEMKYVLIS